MQFQFMQIKSRQEPGLAVCNREGQVLFVHAAPLGLQAGDLFTSRLAGGEARWLAGLSPLPGQAALCLTRRGEAVCLGAIDPDSLLVLQVVDAPPGAVAEVVRRGSAAGFSLSPRLAALAGEVGDGRLETAYLALCRLHPAAWPADTAADDAAAPQYVDLLRRLAALPPLCTRRMEIQLPQAAPSPGVRIDWPRWGSMAYCLAAFLCRSTVNVPLHLTLLDPPGQPVLLLSAPPPSPVPPGSCTIDRLARRFPHAPELAVAAQLAARSGAEITAFGAPDGSLGFACAACRFDPALIGLKQMPTLSDEAAEAAEAEWCRLLPDVGRAER